MLSLPDLQNIYYYFRLMYINLFLVIRFTYTGVKDSRVTTQVSAPIEAADLNGP